MISLIVAMDRNRVIGNKGQLPWHIPADLKYFRRKTKGNIVVMGKNTYLSIGKPLPDRMNFVLTTDKDFILSPQVIVFDSIKSLLRIIDEQEEIYVIGGSKVYEQFLPLADKLYITHINHEFKGDAYFPEYNIGEFDIESSTGLAAGNDTPYDLVFAEYVKNK